MKFEVLLWILVLVSVAVAIALPRYRTYSLTSVGVVIVALVSIVIFSKSADPVPPTSPGAAFQPATRPTHVDFEQFHVDKLDREDPEAKNRIAVTELRFDQIRAEGNLGSGTMDSIGARLYNDSALYTLTNYAYYLVVQDCVKSACTTIYDQRGLAAASVPPNQARDIVISIRDVDTHAAPPFKVLGTSKITLTPTATRAFQASHPTQAN